MGRAFKKIYRWVITHLMLRKWIAGYSPDLLKSDALAGITVAVMVVPQAMAYAVLGGLPPIYGLYASVVPLLIYPLFGTSRHISVGVVAIDMLIISAGVGTLAEAGTSEYVTLVIILCMMVGIIQIAMSVARLGFIVNLLSKPVILGFSLAAPIIIVGSQFGNLLGIDLSQSKYIYVLVAELWKHISDIHYLTAALGVGSILLLLVFKYLTPKIPSYLVVVISASIFVWAANISIQEIDLVGDIPRGLSSIAMPNIGFGKIRRLLPTAITLAFIEIMHLMTVSRMFTMKHNYTVSANQELFALGSSNFIGSFFQSVPISGSFTRSAVNEQTGAKTPISNIFTALIIIIALLFLTSLLYYIPMATLAAIIIVAALGMIDLKEIAYLFKAKDRDGYIALFTFITILFIGIQEGILLGIGASLIGVLFRASRPHIAILGHVEGTKIYRDKSRIPKAKPVNGILTLRVDASFSFTNAEYFKDTIIEIAEDRQEKIHAVIIDGRSINDMDTTALEALKMVYKNMENLDIDLHFAGLKGPVRDVMLRSGLAKEVGGPYFHQTIHEAVTYILEHREEEQTEEEDTIDQYNERVD